MRNFAAKILKQIGLYEATRELYEGSHFSARDSQKLFTRIFKENAWGGKESVSGTGSSIDQTQIVIETLPKIFAEFNIATMLDLPCGDFFWMKNADLSQVKYTGGDLVQELIQQNQRQFGRENVRFRRLNLLVDRLPKVDLVFCRDCLVHLSLEEGLRALRNICQSDSKYLLSTTFPEHPENRAILTGGWRTLNLESPPFSLPPPIRLINEGCREGLEVTDKSLGLWDIRDIKSRLARR